MVVARARDRRRWKANYRQARPGEARTRYRYLSPKTTNVNHIIQGARLAKRLRTFLMKKNKKKAKKNEEAGGGGEAGEEEAEEEEGKNERERKHVESSRRTWAQR